jgi:hypothetical protein
MRPASLALLLSVACAPRPALGPPPITQRLEGHPPTRAHELACELADRAGPRLAGSPGDALARAWAVERMKALGLSDVREEPVAVPRWERGPLSVEVVSPWPQALAATSLGGSISTPPGGITAQVVRVASLEALAALPDDEVKGKIVFFDRAMVRDRDDFASYGQTVGVRAVGAIAAARKGAVASVVRSIATSTARFPHTGMMQYDDGVLRIPAVALAVPDADLLARAIAAGPVTLRLVMTNTQHPDAMSANVVGEVKGRERPGELVLVGAHLDSWDLGPGALDNAAGVSVALEVARLLLADPPRRTVRVVLFANEENGLRGAHAYAREHAAELARHQAAIELDAGAGEAWRLLWSAGDGAEEEMARMAAALAPLGVEDARREKDTGGADLIPLTPSGVPKLLLLQDARRYFDVHHSADDTCDKIDPLEIAQVTAVSHRLVRELAEMPLFLPRSPAPARPE